jgi:hypothetical protein
MHLSFLTIDFPSANFDLFCLQKGKRKTFALLIQLKIVITKTFNLKFAKYRFSLT